MHGAGLHAQRLCAIGLVPSDACGACVPSVREEIASECYDMRPW